MSSFFFQFRLFAFLLVLMLGGILQVLVLLMHARHYTLLLVSLCFQNVAYIQFSTLTHCIHPILCTYTSLSLTQQLFFWSQTLEFVLSIGGALLFCGFIIFDTHMIMHKLSPEEYILASINLYLDFINLFIYILRILQAARKD